MLQNYQREILWSVVHLPLHQKQSVAKSSLGLSNQMHGLSAVLKKLHAGTLNGCTVIQTGLQVA